MKTGSLCSEFVSLSQPRVVFETCMCLFDSVFSTLLWRRSYSSLNANPRHTQLLWIWRSRPTCIQYIQRHTNTPWCMFWGSHRSHDLDAWELFKAITTGAKRRIRAASPSSLNSAQLWIILTWNGWALWLANSKQWNSLLLPSPFYLVFSLDLMKAGSSKQAIFHLPVNKIDLLCCLWV